MTIKKYYLPAHKQYVSEEVYIIYTAIKEN